MPIQYVSIFLRHMDAHLRCADDRPDCLAYLHSLQLSADDVGYAIGAMDRRIRLILRLGTGCGFNFFL